MFFLLAFLAGNLITLQQTFTSSLAKRIGVINSSFISFLVAISILVVFSIINKPSINYSQITEIPILYFAGGVLAVFITLLYIYLLPKLPLIYNTVLAFFGQITASFILDYFLGYDFPVKKVLGIAFIFTGILYIIVYDNIQNKKAVVES